jgi:hypothetical protein
MGMAGKARMGTAEHGEVTPGQARQGTAGLRLKKVYSMADVAALMSSPGDVWSTRRAKDWLIRSGGAFRRGSRWYTTPHLLREHFSEEWQEIMLDLPDDDFDAE